jgi:zinc transport system substrate-binding protein
MTVKKFTPYQLFCRENGNPGNGRRTGENRRRPGVIAGAAMLMIVAIGFLVSAGCTGEVSQPAPGLIPVAVTVLPQAELVKAVGGDRVAVTVLVPPGADPHTYEPTAGQMVSLSESRIYFRLGEGLLPFEDRFVSGLMNVNRNMTVVDTSDGIEFIQEEGGSNHPGGYGKDPHVWLSVRNAEIMVSHISDSLSDADPEHAAEYSRNRDAYLGRLKVLDREIAQQLSGLEPREFLTVHDAWGYFARDYNLTQIAINANDKEPSAQAIQEIISRAREDRIKTVFIEPEFSPRSADVIAEAIGGRVVRIDPLASDYYDNMARIARAFAESQSP